MEITHNGVGITLNLQGGTSLYIGNTYNEAIGEAYIEDISNPEAVQIMEKVQELNKVVSEALTELLGLAKEYEGGL
ncbi:hypothetical protein [Sulfurospirillum sp.]|uniref:hypothetical protein n=1 Tax=Sulfurospirillum sp. TaxID=2053622 RepID=UPI002FDD102F